MIKKVVNSFTIILLIVTCSSDKKNLKQTNVPMNNHITMLIGTYTTGDSKGIYSFRFDQSTGEVNKLSEIAITNPSFLTITSDNKYVFAVSEHNDGKESVSSFRFDKEKGTLNLINSQPAGGEDPCYIITNDKYIITANYSGGSITIFPVKEDGLILPAEEVIAFNGTGLISERQDAPHLHYVSITPDGKYLLANDLGTDQIYKFNINQMADPAQENKFLNSTEPCIYKLKPGSGPRHLSFSPDGKNVYLINELAGTVVCYEYRNGMLTEIQSVASDTVGARGSADIHVSPDGKFLYASNRIKADGLAIFKINESCGLLSKVGYQLTGGHPRNFMITPNGKYLLVACRDKNAIEIYIRNPETGLLTYTEKDIEIEKPVCIIFAI